MGRLTKTPPSLEEGKTPLDDASGLLVDVINREELNAYEFANVSKALAKYLLSKPTESKTPFTFDWFLRVHDEMFGDVWKWAGQIRRTNKSIGIDKVQIREALKLLEKDYHYWVGSKMSAEEIAARLHHRLVWIHPFENGNGRWARLITNIYLKKVELPLVGWPEQVLLEKSDLRKRYLKALCEADRQNFSLLMAIHQSLQKKNR